MSAEKKAKQDQQNQGQATKLRILSKHCQQNLITMTTTGITMINFKFNIGSDSPTPERKIESNFSYS